MTEEEKAKMAKLETDLAAERTARATEKAALEKSIAEKDAVIATKNDDIVRQRHQYKKLSEMTDAEKADMSEKERELQERAEAFEAQQAKFQEDQKAFQDKEISARRERAIAKIAGSDPDLRAKVSDSMKKIVDFDKAQTDEEIANLATSAFNMLGVPKPDPVRSAVNGGDGTAGGDTTGEQYGDTAAGKSLAGSMNLTIAQPEAPAAK